MFKYTAKDREHDPDYDPRQSRAKTGGYQWAGAWIDPSYPLGGPKEHPTMSLAESQKRYAASRALHAKYGEYRRHLDTPDISL